MQRRSVLLPLGVLAVGPALALYDPKPSEPLAQAAGPWRGTLTYRDYQDPKKLVTLPTTLLATFTAPEELALFYVFDDGPGKTVYSYERMRFDFATQELRWSSGSTRPEQSTYTITSCVATPEASRITFDTVNQPNAARYVFELAARSWVLTKFEISATGEETLRNRYELKKVWAAA